MGDDSSTSTSTSSHDENAYHMGRSAAASLRLNLQHYILTARQGWLVHPSIHSHLSSAGQSQNRTPQILDLAAGNGVFTNAIAKEYPNAHVTALDITSAQFPPSWSYPVNSTWSTLNILDDIPDDLVGKFDLIHLRFLLAAAPDIHVENVIPALYKLLRPGGWLQWNELTGTLINTIVPDLTPKWQSGSSSHPIVKALKNSGRAIEAVEVVPSIPKVLGSDPYNMTEIDYVEPEFKMDLVKMDSDVAVTAMEEWMMAMKASSPADSRDGKHDKWKDLEAAVRQVQQEAASGTAFGLQFAVTTAKKAGGK